MLTMNLKQIRYFITISELQSLSKASAKLNIAQPALSSQLKNLEEELGVKLLDRHSRGVSPNDLGLMVLHHFKNIVREVDRTESLIVDYTMNPFGDVHIGVTTTAARAVVSTLVNRAKKRLPKINLHLLEAMSGTLNEQLRKGNLDIAILYNFDSYETDHNLIDNAVAYEKLFLLTNKRDDYNRLGTIKFSKIKDFPLALPSHPHTLNVLLSEMSLRQGVKLNMAAEVNSFTGMVELAKAGFYTIAPIVSVKPEIERGELFAIPISQPALQWTVHIVAGREGVSSRAVRAVHKLITEVVKGLIESGEWEATPI